MPRWRWRRPGRGCWSCEYKEGRVGGQGQARQGRENGPCVERGSESKASQRQRGRARRSWAGARAVRCAERLRGPSAHGARGCSGGPGLSPERGTRAASSESRGPKVTWGPLAAPGPVAQRLGPARGVASRTVPGSPSRETVRGTPRLGSGTRAAIGQRRRRPVKSEGAPCYIFRARRYRGRGGPCYKPGRGNALGETTRCLTSNRPPTVLTRTLVSSWHSD